MNLRLTSATVTPAAAARAGDRQRDIGLRLLAEIDWAQIALVGPRMRELRLLAQVGTARQRIHGKARHLDLLAAVGVEVAHLGDGGRLPQQAQEVEAALLEAAASRQEAGRPADLSLDLLDELLDDGGGALRLLALHGDQRLAALAVGVVHLDGGADDQRTADERHQQGRVLAEQAALLLRLLGRLRIGISAARRGLGAVVCRLSLAAAQGSGQHWQHSASRAPHAADARSRRLRVGLRQRHSITSSARASTRRRSRAATSPCVRDLARRSAVPQ